MKNIGTILLSLVVLLLLLSLSTFTVDERQYALVFRLGKIVAVKKDAGLYFKVPLADNVRYFDKRILTLSWEEADRFLTSEKKNVLVDSFVKWRIVDPVKYYVSVKGDELQAERRLSQTVNDGLRAEFGKRTVQDVISGERSEIMEILRQRADRDSRQMGIQVLDVRLKHVDYPQEVSESVYQRMEAERIKGEGDAAASDTYAKAYSKNPEFYAFYRSLQAYRNSFKNKSDVMVLEPNSDFFKYLKNPEGRAK